MTAQERAAIAAANKKEMNCCQAVCLAFADTLPIDGAALRNLASGFGLGMGCMEATCGALVGAVAVAGMRLGGDGAMQTAKEMLSRFKEKCGAVTCRDLKGVGTGKVLCACEDCVRNAAAIAEEVVSGGLR